MKIYHVCLQPYLQRAKGNALQGLIKQAEILPVDDHRAADRLGFDRLAGGK